MRRPRSSRSRLHATTRRRAAFMYVLDVQKVFFFLESTDGGCQESTGRHLWGLRL